MFRSLSIALVLVSVSFAQCCEPLNVYVFANMPFSTEFGDGIFGGNVPAGWYPVLVTQPTNGTVEISSVGTAWKITTPAIPSIVNGNIADSWQWRATNGTSFGPVQAVQLELVNAAGG